MSIDVPDFPVIAWELTVPFSYEIEVTRNSIVKTVFLNPALSLDEELNYLIRGYGTGNFDPLDVDTWHLAAVLAEAVQHVLSEPAGITPRLPAGGFNLPITVTGGYVSSITPKSFPVIRLEAVSVSWPFAIELDFDTDPVYEKFGFDSTVLTPGERTFPVLGIGNSRSVTFDWSPDGVWAPNNYICYEDRNYLRDTIVNSSAFNSGVIRTVNWSSTREAIRMEYPVVPAEWIYLYRREDPAFAVTTSVNNRFNLLQNLWEHAQGGYYFWLYLNPGESGEQMTYQEEDFVTEMNTALTDATSRGRAFDVALTFVSAQ